MLFQVVGCMIMGSAPLSIGDPWVVTEEKGSDRLKWSLSIIGFNSAPSQRSDQSHVRFSVRDM